MKVLAGRHTHRFDDLGDVGVLEIGRDALGGRLFGQRPCADCNQRESQRDSAAPVLRRDDR
jgi:hypothetical protein